MGIGALALAAIAAGLSLAAASAAEPNAVAQPVLKTGDDWVYDAVEENGTNGFKEGRWEARIEDVRDDGVILGLKRQGAPGAFQDQERGFDWSERRLVEGKPTPTDRAFDFPLAVGKTWVVDYDDDTRHGAQTSVHVHRTYKVTGWEDVTTPAGAFHAVKIEAHGTLKAQMAASSGGVGGVAQSAGDATTVVHTQSIPAHVEYGTTYARFDYAPKVKSFVTSVHETYNAAGVRIHRETRTLESFKPAS